MRGFTLVEMLVAITLMGVMGLVSWRGLDYVARHIERVDRESDELGRVLRVLSQMERDLAQRLPDIMLAAPAGQLSLPGSVSVSGEPERGALEILRLAPDEGGMARAQRIAYRIADGALIRGASAAATAWPPGPAADTVELLRARRLTLRTFAGGFWSEPGGAAQVQPPLPASALEITIEDHEGARYVRVFAL
jgi:general secretion pathway protein J